MDKRKLTKPLEVLSRYKYALLVAALGVALLLWPGRETADGGKTDAGGSQPADIERALEEAEAQEAAQLDESQEETGEQEVDSHADLV